MNIETNKLRNEEIQKSTVEERLEKALHELHHMKNEHMTVNQLEFYKQNYLSLKFCWNFVNFLIFAVIGIFSSTVAGSGME